MQKQIYTSARAKRLAIRVFSQSLKIQLHARDSSGSAACNSTLAGHGGVYYNNISNCYGFREIENKKLHGLMLLSIERVYQSMRKIGDGGGAG